MEYVLLIIGFLLLIKGADYFVDGAASLAYRFHISQTIVGLTIVALGTSLPEAAVSITASIQGSNALAVSNVIGSNIFNMLVVVGASAMLAPFVISKKVTKRDLSFNVFCTVILLIFVLQKQISRFAGILFLILMVCYIGYLVMDARKNPVPEPDDPKEEMSIGKIALYIILGAAAIMVGGDMTVDSARTIALDLGMTETLVGLTIVSVGTSLPELVTSCTAARKGESGLSIGNAIGSSILNILFILGMSSTIHPLSVQPESMIDTMLLLLISVLFLILGWISPKMTRFKGAWFIVIYASYLIYIVMR